MKITGSAGHGLHTPGKRCPDDSMREFMFNVAVFNYFKKEIEQYIDSKGEKVSVIGVHDPTGKKDIPLSTRSNNVNKHEPDLHIDFHANAHGSGLQWTDANGVETFVYKKTLKDAVKVATSVQIAIVDVTGLRDRGVKEDNLHMLRETNPTSILVEGPFMSNRKEAELLKSDSFRRKFALAIVDGIAEAYNLKKNSKKTNEKEGIRMYKPSNDDMLESTIKVMKRLEDKKVHGDKALSSVHREKLGKGELPLDDAIAILFVAHDRGLIVGK
ncbi:N-acetylmuramoyl-L-alanine amidase family protein [Bacillus sp. JJ722]|uniref:N-acetylmuramoyl-L-alanine amidase family protein n=1 Tax=Bacillus sp. JJ722 TaxID=3122973 RepID=UPI002FFE1A09